MVHARRRPVEHEVAGLQGRAVGDVRAGVVLGVRGARQRHTGARVAEGRQARAVEAGVAVGGPVAAPDVREPDLGERRPDGGGGADVRGVRRELCPAQLGPGHRGDDAARTGLRCSGLGGGRRGRRADRRQVRQYRGRADRICRRQQGEGVEADSPAGGPGCVRGVGDRNGLRDGDRCGTHRRAEPGDDQDRGERPSRDRGTADPDSPAPTSTGMVGTASLDAPVLIVVGHPSGSPR